MAKIADFTIKDKTIKTPALFPVVDPFQQTISIQSIKEKFGFDQVITSAYLMSKRLHENKSLKLPEVHNYLDYDGFVMMDSGAYQVMLYGDIELGTKQSIQLQETVKTDLGVIMDHPIGYDVSYNEAKKRNETTIRNLQESLDFIIGSDISWTLPIQGGRYIELLNQYLAETRSMNIYPHFDMFALGSVVPIMINQDYETLIRMIVSAKSALPVDKPLHLFGAGHPAMFALATFLGCDTFDSAAYALMAKDDRYMTVEGTYDLNKLIEFPCSCSVCTSYTVNEVIKLEKPSRLKLLSEHNLFVSSAEIRRIRNAIHENKLWNLVLQRANSVPRLSRATRLAIKLLSEESLKQKYQRGVPISSTTAPRIAHKLDLKQSLIRRINQFSRRNIDSSKRNKLLVIGYNLSESLYNKFPYKQIEKFLDESIDLVFLIPVFNSLIPFGLNEAFPVAQLTQELDLSEFSDNLSRIQAQIKTFEGYKEITYILPLDWEISLEEFCKAIKSNTSTQKIHYTYKPMSKLIDVLQSFN